VRRIKALAPGLPVLIISGDSDPTSIVERCAAGAGGYVLKPLAPEELARALASVARGQPVLCPEAQKALLHTVHGAATATTLWARGLSSREQEVAGCLLAGWSEKDIADRLGIMYDTLHVHLVRIYKKLGVHSRKQAVAKLLGVWRGGGGD
jgi:DNA-binding NarL/FixJ family response regulator